MKKKTIDLKSFESISAKSDFTYPEIRDVVDEATRFFNKIDAILITKKTNIVELFSKKDIEQRKGVVLFYSKDESHKSTFDLLSSEFSPSPVFGEALFSSIPFFLSVLGKKSHLKKHIQNMQAIASWKFANILWVMNNKLANKNKKEDLTKIKVISIIYILRSLCHYSWDKTYYNAVEILKNNKLINSSRIKITQMVRNAIPKRYDDITSLFEKSGVLEPIKNESHLKNILRTMLGDTFVDLFFDYPKTNFAEYTFTYLATKSLISREIMGYGLIAKYKSNESSNMVGREIRKIIYELNKEVFKIGAKQHD